MSEQSDFWKGDFGDEYSKRNVGRVESNKHFFQKALHQCRLDMRSIVELGCGTGENLAAIAQLLPWVEINGVEINESAAEKVPVGNIIRGDFLKTEFFPICNLSFTKGVMIHIPPEDLPKAYTRLYEASDRYIMIAEYHSPRPEMVPYRGHENRMWKRDFAKELWEMYDDLEFIDSGFAWSKDPNGAQDDLTFFLFRKSDAN